MNVILYSLHNGSKHERVLYSLHYGSKHERDTLQSTVYTTAVGMDVMLYTTAGSLNVHKWFVVSLLSLVIDLLKCWPMRLALCSMWVC